MGSLDLLQPPSHQTRKNSSSSIKLRGSFDLPTIDENETSSGLDKLKRVTKRLELTTRRPSILEWRESVKRTLSAPTLSYTNGTSESKSNVESSEVKERSDKERRENIDSALEWLRSELKAMKAQDHLLAMQLMGLRAEIQKIKLQKTSCEHQDLIDNSAYSVEEESELKSGLYDTLPFLLPSNNNYQDVEYMSIVDKPLKDMGVTRMNLNTRRFSIK